MSMVSIISVFHCTLVINPARLFHNFQNVECLVLRWMICNYDIECILITLNDLYYVEWYALSWIICICICTNVEWFGRFNETYSWQISPGKLPQNFLSHENPNYEHCPIRNHPFCGKFSGGNSCFATNGKHRNLKI